MVYNTVAGVFNPVPIPQPTIYYASSFNSTSGTGAGPRTLASIAVPAQSYAWIPSVKGNTVVSGSANTQVVLQAFLGTTSGPLVGVGYGVAGVPQQSIWLGGLPGGGVSPIAAGTGATILLCATQVASTTDAWSTSSTTTAFEMQAYPGLVAV